MLCMLGPRLIRHLKSSSIRYVGLKFPVVKALLIDAIAGIHYPCVTGRVFLAPCAASTDFGGGAIDSVPAVRVDISYNVC